MKNPEEREVHGRKSARFSLENRPFVMSERGTRTSQRADWAFLQLAVKQEALRSERI